MASFRQRNNKWQARIKRDSYPDQVKTFGARVDAERWARSVESEMDNGQFVDTRKALRTTLKELILRYVREVTPTMKSVSNARHLPQKGRPSVVFMVEHLLGQKQSKAASVAPMLKPSMAMKRAKREPHGLKVCVGFVHLKSQAMRLGS